MGIKRKKTILAACCLFFVLCASILFCACTSQIGTSASESGNQEEVVEIPNGEDSGTDEEPSGEPGEDSPEETLPEEELPGGDEELPNDQGPDQPTEGDQSGQEEQQPEVVYEEEETILFANNGVGYVLNPFADGEFSFEVESEEVLTALPYFKSAIALSPVSVGETKLTVKIATDEKIRIKVYNIIVLPFDEVLNIEIESLEGKELKGGARADGSYLIYNANVVSCRNLTIEDFSIEKSDNIFIVENSVVAAKTENGGTRLSFSFYVSGGQEAKIKVFAENNFVNLLTPTIAEETYVVSEFLREISYSLTNEGKSPIEGENGFKLYLPTIGFEDELDKEGYYTYYNLTIDKTLFSVSTMSSNIEIVESEGGFVIYSKEEGTARVLISAKDGSNLSESFIIETAPLLATEYIVSLNGEEFNLMPDGFLDFLLGLDNFEINQEDEPYVLEISKNPIFSKTEYQIVVANGNSVDLNYETVGGSTKLSFIPVETGTTEFNILYKGRIISSFTVDVKEKEYEILIENFEDEIEIDLGSSVKLVITLTHFGEVITKPIYSISCNQSGAIFDSLTYNGTVFIRFESAGEYYFTIEASDYGVSRTIKFIVA